MRPHVVHVLHGLDTGGTENGVVNLVCALDQEFRHTVVSMTGVGPLAQRLPAGVAVHALGKRPGLDLATTARLAGLLRRLRPDVVHSRNWAAFDAVPAGRLAGVPAIVHGEHGREMTDPHGLSSRRNRLRRALSPLVRRFVAVSFDLRRWLLDVVRVPAAKVITIHNGVDICRWATGDREAGRRALGVPADSFVIGTVGRLDPVKDQIGLLEAFAALSGQPDRLVLVLVGDGPCRERLESRARQADLDGRVRFLGERADVPALLPGMDVFALPSIAEGVSNTLLEAMAARLPVVATRAGGTPEIVEQGATGSLVPVGDRHALAQALVGYIRDPGLRARHGEAGRRRVLEHFALDRMAERYRALYLDLTGSRN